jgi:hypothetical protein
MVAVSPILSLELARMADAGGQLLDVAKNLQALAASAGDPQLASALRVQINRLLDTAELLNGVIRSSAFLRA